MKYRKKISIILVLTVFIMGMLGCGKSTVLSEEESTDQAEEENAGQTVKEELWVDVSDYQKKLLDGRKTVAACHADYKQETEQVRNSEYGNLRFSSCEFADFPECEDISLLRQRFYKLSPKESWEIIEQTLEDLGKRDQIDMEKEVRVVTDEVEWDMSQEYPYFYPALAEHMDLEDATLTFLITEQCYVRGIAALNDGKIKDYLGIEGLVGEGTSGTYSDDVVLTGSVLELRAVSYPLISDEISVKDGAELVKDYFEAGTPIAPPEGISVDVPEVSVFRLGDVYGYDYMVRRVYRGIPFAYTDYSKNFQVQSIYLPIEDIKHAYVVDDTGVSAYVGYNECEPIEVLYSDTEMIGIQEAAKLVSEKLASHLSVEVQNVSLEYAPYYLDGNIAIVIFPCWKFDGINTIKNEKIRIFMDVLTGDIYYYTSRISEE